MKGAVLNTTEHGAEVKGGREGPDHSFTFLLHFYFRHWKRKQKKRVQEGEKSYHESTSRYKEGELVGRYDHEMNRLGGGRARGDKDRVC